MHHFLCNSQRRQMEKGNTFSFFAVDAYDIRNARIPIYAHKIFETDP